MFQGQVQSPQAPSSVVMVRPKHFAVNEQTAGDNAFQKNVTGDHAQAAFDELTCAAEILRGHGVEVHLFDDNSTDTPDSVFPNNWFSTHPGGQIALYPMMAPNRRLERRSDITDALKRDYRVQQIIDYSGLEHEGLYLEGTGAMVLDHVERVAYTVLSERANPAVLDRFCAHFNYEPIVFSATDEQGMPIYHTNVLMGIGTEFVMIGLDQIKDSAERDMVEERLRRSGRAIIPLAFKQIVDFAGNAIELQGREGRILALSQTAFDSLDEGQKQQIEKSAKLVPLEINTIELSGGSVRCTIAGVHLSRR